MNILKSLLTPQLTFVGHYGHSKKKALQTISTTLAQQLTYLEACSVFDSLMARERLGSTGFGKGIAIPHCRLAQCIEIVAAFFRLTCAIDFDAADNQPVDLLCVLLVPEHSTDQHLTVLSNLAQLLNDQRLTNQLRAAESSAALYVLLQQYQSAE